MGVIDREDIVAAPKFLLCRDGWFTRYQDELLAAFKRFHFILDADMENYFAGWCSHLIRGLPRWSERVKQSTQLIIDMSGTKHNLSN